MSDFKTYSAIIDGLSRGLILDERPGTEPPRETSSLPLQAQRVDDGSNPNEVRYEYGLPFGQGDFSHGAGQVFFHGEGRDPRMFLYSEGFDISEPGRLKHLRTAPEAYHSEDIGRCAIIDDLPFVIDGTNIMRGDGNFPGTWTAEDPHDGESAVDAFDICARGDEGFAALGANGIHGRSAAGAWSHFQPDGATDLDVGAASIVRFLKDRLMVVGANGREIYEVVADSTPTSLKTLPTGWEYTDVWENGPFIYASAVSTASRLSRIHHFGLDASGGELVSVGSSAMPDNQLCYSGYGYLDVIYLGAGKRNDEQGLDPVIYRAFPAQDGSLRLEKLAEEEGTPNDFSVGAIAADGESVLFGWSLGANSEFGLQREGLAIHHLARLAFAHHLKREGAGAAPTPPSEESETRNPVTTASVAGSGADWTNPGNVVSSNDTYATQTSPAVSTGPQNTIGARAFGLAVPGGATIDGVEVQIKRKASVAGQVTDETVRLTDATGAAAGSNKALGPAWATTDTLVTYGGPTDLWGIALTPAIVNDADFGVNLQAAIDDVGVTASVDCITIKVFYTTADTFDDTDALAGGDANNGGNLGSPDWTSPANALVRDTDTTTVALPTTGSVSNSLVTRDHAFTIPSDATINGIRVTVRRKLTGTEVVLDSSIRLSKNGLSPVGDNKATATGWPATLTDALYGGPTDLWGTTWTPAQINDANFGVMFSARTHAGGGPNAVAEVDYIEIEVFWTVPAVTDDTGIVFPTVATLIEVDAGFFDWIDEDNLFASDGVYATCVVPSDAGVQDTLRATNFGFNIPAGSEIKGIEVTVERKASASGSVRDETVMVTGGADKAVITDWPTSDAVATYGGPTDKWGASWEPGDINDADFGVDLAASYDEGGLTASVDHITVKVYWTENPPTPGRVTSISVYDDRILFTVEGQGLYYEDLDTYVAEATMVPSLANFNSMSEKSWETIELSFRPLPADTSIEVDYTDRHPDEDDWTPVVSPLLSSDGRTKAVMRLGDVRSDVFDLRLRSQATPDGSVAPEIVGFTVSANPSTANPQFILRRRFRVVSSDRKDDNSPEVFYSDPDAAVDEIEALLFQTIALNEPGRAYLARVESFKTEMIGQADYSASEGESSRNAYSIELLMVGTRADLPGLEEV